ncbi:MAG: geranylgeranyl reductase family protein [Thermoplasmata archaeon]|nr:MAG: geranylgeranyl reductase family protein [Thermoplasmata archaeon]
MDDDTVMYDVAIIGAGPAGSSAAYTLEQWGYSILLTDKEIFPRKKACAGVLPPRIFSELDIPEDVIEMPLKGYRIFSPQGEMVESVFPKPGAIVRRENFDLFLVNRLKKKPRQMRITECVPGNDSVKIIGEGFAAKAKIVIGTDGVNSRVKKTCLAKGSGMNEEGDTALGVQYEISLPEGEINRQFGGWFEVHYTLPYGYFWISPLKSAVKVGCGATSLEFKRDSRAILDDFLEHERVRERLANGHMEHFESHLIPMKGPLDILTSGRVILAGDAGGFVFPGTGEGVFYAVKSGRIAGEVAARALEEGVFDAGFLGHMYSKQLDKSGLGSLRDVDFVERVLSSPERAHRYVMRLKALGHF